VGGIKTLKVDVRLVTATNRDLQKEVATGNFREDVFYRLNVVPIHLPPLRERASDIPVLVEHFVGKFNERLKKQVSGVDADAMARLTAYPWPGNIRELENVLERTILFAPGPQIHARDLPPELNAQAQAVPAAALSAETSRPEKGVDGSLKELVRVETERLERELIQRALDETGGNVTQAAKRLKISRKSLQNKMKEFGLRDREA
jgi:DNA-binding NtrC family response regulator